MIKSCNNKTQPPRVMMAGLGGLGNDLTSIKWSFLSYLTSNKVCSNILFASATDSSASFLRA